MYSFLCEIQASCFESCIFCHVKLKQHYLSNKYVYRFSSNFWFIVLFTKVSTWLHIQKWWDVLRVIGTVFFRLKVTYPYLLWDGVLGVALRGVWLLSLSQGWNPVVPGFQSPPGTQGLLQAHGTAGHRAPSGPCPVGLSMGQLTTWLLASSEPQASEREEWEREPAKGKVMVIYTCIWEVL